MLPKTRSNTPSKIATKTFWTDHHIGKKTVDGGVGKGEAERRARLRRQGGLLLQAKRNQVMTQLFVLLDLPLSISIAAFLGPVDQWSCRPAERKPCPESGRKRSIGGSSRPHCRLSIPERIGFEGMRLSKRMCDRHVSDWEEKL